MTLKDKKNKREYEKKQKTQGGSKDDKSSNSKEKSKPSKAPPGTKQEPEPPAATSNFVGVAEDADKLITDANLRYLAAETEKEEEEVNPKYAKRNITSNWTKYELPPSDDSEDETSQTMTGADYDYVMSSAQGAEAHFRLKSEKEWESQIENLGELSEEFFSLDLTELERSVSSIPLHKQVCLAEEQFDKDLLERLVRKAEAVKEGSLACSDQVEGVISQKILDILSVGKTEKPKELLTSELKQNIIASTEVGEAEVKGVKSEEVLEQRQNNRRGRGKVVVDTELINNINIISKSTDAEDIVEVAPLDQRLNRRQRGTKSEEHSIKEKVEKGDDDETDLKFLENLEKDTDKLAITDTEQASSKPVVPVNIVGEDTKNLEDWLDDFLDD